MNSGGMRSLSVFACGLAAVFGILFHASVASAATYYWDTIPISGVITGGSGTWGTTATTGRPPWRATPRSRPGPRPGPTAPTSTPPPVSRTPLRQPPRRSTPAARRTPSVSPPARHYRSPERLAGRARSPRPGPGASRPADINTYGGGTTADDGTLEVMTSDAIPYGSGLTVGSGGTVDFGDPSGAAASMIRASSPAASPADHEYMVPALAAVPEPGTLALLVAAGIVAAAAWRRKGDYNLVLRRPVPANGRQTHRVGCPEPKGPRPARSRWLCQGNVPSRLGGGVRTEFQFSHTKVIPNPLKGFAHESSHTPDRC